MAVNMWREKLKTRGANLGKGASEAQIAEMEEELGLKLPADYRAFLREVGWAEIDTESGVLSIAGLGEDTPLDLFLTVIAKEARGSGLDKHLLPIADEGDFLFIDTKSTSGSIVYLEDNEERPIAGSFTAWLSEELSD
jgi:hypothetical protein